MGRRRPGTAAALIALAGLLSVAASATPALAGPRPHVKPNQGFDGLVNGNRGAVAPVKVFVDCHPGRATGHPVAGQTVEIQPADPASASGASSGNTGDTGTSVEAFFGAPPPADGARALKTTVSFRRYYLSRPIPRAVVLPCSGDGQVTFVAFPRTPPTSKPAVVPVSYFVKP